MSKLWSAAFSLLLCVLIASPAASQQEGYADALALEEAGQEREALSRYRILCEQGDDTACWRIGRYYRDGRIVGKDVDRANSYFRRSCDAGDPMGCASLTYSYYLGRGVAKDWTRAVALAEPHCFEGTAAPIICNYLGIIYEKGGNGIPRNVPEAARLYRLACEGGRAYGCSNLGRFYSNGTGLAEDQAQATALFRKACDLELGLACRSLGLRLLNGTGTAKDLSAGIASLERGCDLDDNDSCVNFGFHERRRIGDAEMSGQRGQAVVAAYRKACENRNGYGCSNLAVLYLDGIGVETDRDRAEALFRQGCEVWGGACRILAVEYEYGDKLRRDARQALELYDRGCSAEDARACRGAAEMLRYGRWIAAEPVRAIEYFEKACALDDERACKQGERWREIESKRAASIAGVVQSLGELKGNEERAFEVAQRLNKQYNHREAFRILEALCFTGSGEYSYDACKSAPSFMDDGVAALYLMGNKRGHMRSYERQIDRAAMASRACYGNDDQFACFRMAQALDEGKINVNSWDLQRTTLLIGACEGDVAYACKEAASAVWGDKTRDRGLIRRLLERGCALDHWGSCNDLEQMKQGKRYPA